MSIQNEFFIWVGSDSINLVVTTSVQLALRTQVDTHLHELLMSMCLLTHSSIYNVGSLFCEILLAIKL